MPKINEIKEQQVVVRSVGDFANSLQQIATMRMVTLRKSVLASRQFVDEATLILKELKKEKKKQFIKELQKYDKNFVIPSKKREAIIVVTSYQGLCGSYNTEIFKRIDKIVPQHPEADYFVVGTKGQEYFRNRIVSKNPQFHYYPYDIPEDVKIEDLRRLVTMFAYYDEIYLIYSKYINTATREVVFLGLAEPGVEEEEKDRIQKEKKQEDEEGRFMFEPNIDELIENITAKLRYALFRQQILDSKLSLYTSQMVAMQTASENADQLMKDLQMEYNKARRKLIDKKIQEVQAGRSLWA
jgi:F-type H+-transporting ATPase subunit gamma